MDYRPPGSSIHGIFQAKNRLSFPSPGGLPFPSSGDLPDPGIEPASLVSCFGRQVSYQLSLEEVQNFGVRIRIFTE